MYCIYFDEFSILCCWGWTVNWLKDLSDYREANYFFVIGLCFLFFFLCFFFRFFSFFWFWIFTLFCLEYVSPDCRVVFVLLELLLNLFFLFKTLRFSLRYGSIVLLIVVLRFLDKEFCPKKKTKSYGKMEYWNTGTRKYNP